MKLNTRARDIIQTLLAKEQAYITTGCIAEAIGVSAKTVMRELDEVSRVLAGCGLELEKKTGSGLGIKGSPAKLENLRNFLRETEEEHIYSPEERHSVIVSQLLARQEPVKLYAFASRLNVSEGTVSKDLDKLEPWFRQQRLRLIRKPGLGVYLQGEEKHIRKAIMDYIYTHIGEEALLGLMKENFAAGDSKNTRRSRQDICRSMLGLVDEEILHSLEDLVRELDGKLVSQLSDNAFIGLVAHLSLAVQRIRKNERIAMDGEVLRGLRSRKEFQAAEALGRNIAARFQISVPEDEVGYITMHLLGARNRYDKDHASASVMDNFHLVKLAKGIMRRAEEASGKSIRSNSGLLVGLVNHLGPSISRLKMDMNIRNPLLGEMKTQYPELMEISRYAVRDLEETLGTDMPDSEIAYIAMHLGAALEDRGGGQKTEYRVIVACPTGMGTSRMLASRLRREYEELRIVDQTSTMQLDAAYLSRTTADFIISTVPIPENRLPTVVVSPLLRESDREAIDRRLSILQAGRHKEQVDLPRPGFKEGLAGLEVYSRSILTLLQSFFFIEAESFRNMKEICRRTGSIVGRDAEEAAGIAEALIQREACGSTMVWGHGIVLLHCQSQYVPRLQLGVIHTGEQFAYDDSSHEKPRTVIVMAAPSGASAREKETIGYISSILLERWGLIELLHEGDQELIYHELEKIFREFFQEKYQQLMEG
ncbi:MAG: PRD domain-containing protein [Anaerovibrio sp.]|nr:PRD domain-containing protein [Anaerovibrio sp.]